MPRLRGMFQKLSYAKRVIRSLYFALGHFGPSQFYLISPQISLSLTPAISTAPKTKYAPDQSKA